MPGMRPEWGDPPGYDGGGGFGGLSFPALTSVTKALLWANAIVFGALFLLVRLPGGLGESLYGLLSLEPAQWWGWFPLVPVWQLVTYGFVHSLTDIFHILFNLLALYFFGTMVEGVVGGRRFLVAYMTAIVLGGIAQLTMGLIQLGQGIPVGATLGASGGVMAMIIAAAVMQPNARIIFFIFPLRLATLALILVGIDVFRMLTGGSGTAWLVHLTGAAYGFLAVRRRWIWADPLASWERRRQVRQVEQAAADSQRVDELLARIQRDGMQSLSSSEKAFLKRVSSRKR